MAPENCRKCASSGAKRLQVIEVKGPRIVLIEDARFPIIQRQPRVADRPVGGSDERHDHEAEAVSLIRLVGPGPDERMESELLQFLLEMVQRVFGEEDRGVLRDVLGEELRIEMVVVKVGDIEIVGTANEVEIKVLVARKWEP